MYTAVTIATVKITSNAMRIQNHAGVPSSSAGGAISVGVGVGVDAGVGVAVGVGVGATAVVKFHREPLMPQVALLKATTRQ
jgi:hypothetical protein